MNRVQLHRRQHGFTLVELLIVVAILMAMAALAIPSMSNVIGLTRLRSSMGEISGTIQDCRTLAIKTNRTRTAHFTTVSGQTVVFVKESTKAATVTSKDPQVWLVRNITKVDGSSAPAGLDPNTMWGGGPTPEQTAEPSFNPRGMPCKYSSSTGKCTSNIGFLYFFSYSPIFSGTRWAAVSISPAGRIKSWYWNGSSWSD